MAIGAQDYIDQLLVRKYATEKADNHDAIESMVKPEEMMAAMNDYSTVSRNMMALNRRLTAVCLAVNSINAQYNRPASL